MPTETSCIIKNVRKQLTDIVFRHFVRIFRHWNDGETPRPSVAEDMVLDTADFNDGLLLRREEEDPYSANREDPPLVVIHRIVRIRFFVTNETEVSFKVVRIPNGMEFDEAANYEDQEKDSDLSLDEMAMIAEAFEKEYPTV